MPDFLMSDFGKSQMVKRLLIVIKSPGIKTKKNAGINIAFHIHSVFLKIILKR